MAITTESTLMALPNEILTLVLTNLPLPSLLSFALTSTTSYQLATTSLTTLQLASFSKRTHGILSLLDADSSYADLASAPNQIVLSPTSSSSLTASSASATSMSTNSSSTTTRIKRRGRSRPSTSPREVRHQNFLLQNHQLATTLSSPFFSPSNSNIRNLTIHTSTLTSPTNTSSPCLGTILSTRPTLHSLTLNFSHPHIADSILPPRFWTSMPRISEEGSIAWNALAGIGSSTAESHSHSHSDSHSAPHDSQAEAERNTTTTNLESLTIIRGAATAKQLEGIVRMNRRLRLVKLVLCSGVEREFVEALGATVHAADKSQKGAQWRGIKVLELEQCGNLVLNSEEDFNWIDRLVDAGLEELSLRDCGEVDGEVLKTVAEERNWLQRGLWRLVGPDDLDKEEEAKSLVDEEMCGSEGAERKSDLIEVDPAYV